MSVWFFCDGGMVSGEHAWKVFTFEWTDADAGNCFQVIKLAELLPLKVFSAADEL